MLIPVNSNLLGISKKYYKVFVVTLLQNDLPFSNRNWIPLFFYTSDQLIQHHIRMICKQIDLGMSEFKS